MNDALKGRVKRLRNWPADIFLQAERKKNTEDMPFFHFAQRPIVSGKLKAVIESVAPRQVQWLPIAGILFRGKKLDVGDYWCMNILREIDCVNKRRSYVDKEAPGDYPHLRAALDLAVKADKVPPHVRIFRPLNIAGWILCDDVLRDAIVEAGCTGVSMFGILGQAPYDKFL